MDWIKEELYDFILIKDEKGLVCILHEDEQEKAQLICKAPEMLEILQLTCMELESAGKTHWDIYGMIKQLIKESTTI